MVEYIGQAKTPWWFWVVAILALLWNLMGVMAYLGGAFGGDCLLYTSPSPRDQRGARMPSSA